MRSDLEMKAANRPLFCSQGVIDLGDRFLPTDAGELFRTKQATQKSAIIADRLSLYDLQSGNWRFDHREPFHAADSYATI
jgi:hypothetical protein